MRVMTVEKHRRSAWGRVCVSSLAARGQVERRASASLWQACPDTVLQRRVAMKVAFLGGLSVPEGQVPLFLSTLASALPVERGTIGPDPGSIGLKSRPHRPTFPHFPQFPRFPHLIFSTVHVCSVPPPVRNKRNRWNKSIGIIRLSCSGCSTCSIPLVERNRCKESLRKKSIIASNSRYVMLSLALV